ncbi:hypothetical protein [Streptosporangium sp. NPDC087985]|uniref:hypothetical protein n=1 Tax=Streptosporangium sp. NPDC087985 TaxID=3366196 RepID=UPI003815F58C
MWELIAATGNGFPWLNVAGKVLTGWVIIDIDATIIGAHSASRAPPPRSRKPSGSIRSAPGVPTPPSP